MATKIMITEYCKRSILTTPMPYLWDVGVEEISLVIGLANKWTKTYLAFGFKD